MRRDYIQDMKSSAQLRNKRLQWLVYLPGALIISYGFWLSLTLQQ